MSEEEKILEKLDKIRDSNKLVLVEGEKDKKALKKFDIINVKTLKGPIFKFVEEVSCINEEVIILMDLDKEGKKLYSQMRKGFEMKGVKMDDEFREFLFKETKLRQIEGLDTYLKNCKS